MALDDRQLAKRLTRDARAATRASARVRAAHARAVERRERALRRARHALPWRAGTAVAAATYAVAVEPGLLVGTVGAVAAVGAFRSLVTLLRPPVAPLLALPPAAPAAPVPDRRSAAWPAVRRLEAVRGELVRLLPLVSPAGRDVADEAWGAAAEADAALRWQAARLAAVEPHRGAEPGLLRPLYAGVERSERLVLAVADLVCASADPLAASRLQDATDAVHGLAQGLREVR